MKGTGKKEFEDLADEFDDLYQEALDDLEKYTKELSRSQREAIEDFHDEQMGALEEIMGTMSDMFATSEDALNDLDKQLHQTMLLRRQKELKKLEKDYDKRFRELRDDQDEYFDRSKKGHEGILDKLSKIAEISAALDIGGIRDSLEETSQSNLEIRHQIKATLGLAGEEYENFNKKLSDSVSGLNDKFGDKFASQEFNQLAASVVDDLGARNTDHIVSLTESLAKFQKATGMEGADNYESIFKMTDRWKESTSDITNTFNDLAVMGSRLGFETNAEDFVNAMNLLGDSILKNSKSAEEAQQRMANVGKTTTMLADSFIDPEAWFSSLKEISSATPEQLGDLQNKYAWMGMNVQDIKNRYDQGDIASLTADMLDSMRKHVTSDNSQYKNMIKDQMGIEGEDWTQLQLKLTEDPKYFTNKIAEIEGAYQEAISKGSESAKAIEDIHVSLLDKIKNKITSSEIGEAFTNIFDDLDLSLLDIYAGIQLIKGGSGVFKSMMSFGGKVFTKLTGLFGGGAGNLLGAISTKASTLFSGVATKVAGTAGSVLGSTTATAAGTTAAAGSSVLSALLPVLGGGLGVAGLVDSITDLKEANEAVVWQQKETKQKSAALKGGMVAAGAAIGSVVPGVGTLIGAGVGGLIGLIGGDKVATKFQEWTDGTSKINDAMEALNKTQSEVDESMSKVQAFEKLEKQYKKQTKSLKQVSKGTSEYDQNTAEIKNTIRQMNDLMPGYVQVESDGVTIREDSLEATEKMIAAEKELARIRTQSAVNEAMKVEDTLEKQLKKSSESVAESEGKAEDITKLNELFQNLKKYESEFYDEKTGEFSTDNLSKEAQKAYDAWVSQSKDLYKNAGLDSMFDGVNWAQGKEAYAQGVYENLLKGSKAEDMEETLNKVAEAKSDEASKKKAYNEGYTNAVQVLEKSLGMSFEEAAKKYGSMSQTDKTYFENALTNLDKLGGQYNMLEEGVRKDVSELKKTAGIDGSHEDGLWKVPHDGYIAELHKDEAVLTRQDANVWRGGGTGAELMGQANKATADVGVNTADLNMVSLRDLDGSHEDGLWKVPHDNYRALLHKDEAVLTKEDADDWRSKIKQTKPIEYVTSLIQGTVSSLGGFLGGAVGSLLGAFTGGVTASGDAASIWSGLLNAGYTKSGVAGLMGNLYAESGLQPNNVQNSYNRSLGMSDSGYTRAVDDGSYKNFVNDAAGYGLAQWTYHSRKRNLLDFAKSTGSSIGDLSMQIQFLVNELANSYAGVDRVLKTTSSVEEASNKVLLDFERPANATQKIAERARYSMGYYNKFAGLTDEGVANAVGMPKYEKGTDYVPETQIALVHKGERIIPASENQQGASVGLSTAVTARDNSDIIQVLRWGFDYLGKKMENIQPAVIAKNEEPKKKESRTATVFKLGGVLA